MANGYPNKPGNSLAPRGQGGGAVNGFDDRGVKFTSFINGSAVKKLLTQSLGGPQQAAQVTSTLISQVSANEKLQQCQPMTILSAALRGEIGMGLSLVLGDYAIIPYGDQAQFQLQVNGLKRMCINSGAYEDINCFDVRDGEFAGRDPVTRAPIFKWLDDEEREQLPIIGYYAFFKLNAKYNGLTRQIYWTHDKILRHADRYSKAFSLSIWQRMMNGETGGTDERGYKWTAAGKRAGSPWYGEPTDEAHKKMCMKTVLKQLLADGFAPKSTTIQTYMNADEAMDKSGEAVYYGDEFDRMAEGAAMTAARESLNAAQTQGAPAMPPAPENPAQGNVAAPVASPAPPAPPAEQTAPAKRGRPAKAGAAQAPAPAPMPAPEQPPFTMSDFPEFQGGSVPADDPFAGLTGGDY